MTSKKSTKPTAEAVTTDDRAPKAASPLKLSKAAFRLLQRNVRNQDSAESQEFAALVGAFVLTQAAATKAAGLLSEMLHSDTESLSSIQQHLDEHPLEALALVRLIGLERERGAGQIERATHHKMSSSGGKKRVLNEGYAAKREQIRAAWASGKFATRQLCAEQEHDAIGMSFETARKALRNTPDPNRST